MILYFREACGSYVAIDTSTRRLLREAVGRDVYLGRVAADEGDLGSVSTCEVEPRYLLTCCLRLPKSKVPARWRQAIGW